LRYFFISLAICFSYFIDSQCATPAAWGRGRGPAGWATAEGMRGEPRTGSICARKDWRAHAVATRALLKSTGTPRVGMSGGRPPS
jgi:hypothetical protein